MSDESTQGDGKEGAGKRPFSEYEKKWQEIWEREGIYRAKEPNGKKEDKFYGLVEFPYPSGAGLHTGHPRSYTAIDIVTRKRRMEGKNVLYPIGWDAFGLPTENYAIKNKIKPQDATKANVANFKRQLKMLGLGFDWSREVNTTDPAYYKWTQWMFLQFFKSVFDEKEGRAKLIAEGSGEKGQGSGEESGARMAYKAKTTINWCPSCKIGLANEEAVGGVCERCGAEVEKRVKEQWMIRITKYAERLLKDLETVDYLEKIKTQQINWIGKSEGAMIDFDLKIDATTQRLTVFTTRPDTLFGVTYVVLAPEHELVSKWIADGVIANAGDVEAYRAEAAKKTDIERAAEDKEKTGVKLEGVTAINPANGESVPVFIADYALANYGTGAVMAVPAHDERDHAFAKKYGLPIKFVVSPGDRYAVDLSGISLDKNEALKKMNHVIEKNRIYGVGLVETENGLDLYTPDPSIYYHIHEELYGMPYRGGSFSSDKTTANLIPGSCFTGYGTSINSNFLNGSPTDQAKKKISAWLAEQGKGGPTTTYKLRDWVFSRQRYWGEPIPIVICPKCGYVPVPEDQLPVLLPDVESYETTDTGESPLSKIREWVETTCPECGGKAERETDTMPNWAGSSWYFLRYCDPKNDQVFADAEKLKYWMPVDLYNGGMEHTTLHLLYSRFWHKVLWDLGVIPNECGSEPYMRRRSQGLIMAEGGEKMSKSKGNVVNPDEVVNQYGADVFRVYEMFMGPFDQPVPWDTNGIEGVKRFLDKVWRLFEGSGEKGQGSGKLETVYHQTVKKVTDDIESFGFNTAISQLMILTNAFIEAGGVPDEMVDGYLKILAPFAPHLAEELWHKIGKTTSIHLEPWPTYDPAKVVASSFELVIQVNGKVRDRINVPADISEEDAKAKALASDQVKKYLEGKEPKKIIYIKGRLVTIAM